MADLSDGDSLGPLCRDCAPPSCHLPPTRDGSGATVGSRERTVPCLAGDHCGGRGGGAMEAEVGWPQSVGTALAAVEPWV
jgi:hypothetical protein